MRGQSAGAAFVGRSGDLEVVLDAYARAERGEGAVILVGGEAGVGKTRLVGEAGAQARRHGARVLVGQCLDLEEGGLPYAPLVDMLRTLDRDLTPEEGAATLGSLRAFLGRAGEADPPVLRRWRPAPRAARASGRPDRPGRPVCSSCSSR